MTLSGYGLVQCLALALALSKSQHSQIAIGKNTIFEVLLKD